jgi:hypothetical protein
MMHQKRGQITIFIIIGIILLLTAALFIYLRQEITIFRPREVYPPEVMPIVDFMDSCLNELGIQAANIVGSTGGYIEIPPEIANNPSAHISLAPPGIPTAKVALWYYEGQNRIPPLEFIQGQMEEYIEFNYRDCINNLEEFRQRFNITELGPLVIRVKLEEENTPIELSFPLEISDVLGKRIAKIETRTTILPYRIKKAHALATSIMEAEQTDMKIEDITMDLIAMDPDIPYSDMAFECQKKRWQIEDIIKKLKILLRTNLDEIRIGNTGFAEVPENKPYIFHHYIWFVTDVRYPDMTASFTYDDRWPLYLYARPNKGAYLESGMQKGFDMLSWLCIQTWKFTYDIRYPVMVAVLDKKSGYSLNFAFRALIDHSQPTRQSFPETEFEFETNPTEEEYCTRKVHDITVLTYDNVSIDGAEDYIEIDDVDISFTCLKYTCSLGKTEWADGGAVASLTARFPYCVLGILRGKKEGYKDAYIFMSSERPQTAELYLTPLKEIENYLVVKHPDQNPLLEQPLAREESVSIAIERPGHSAFGLYPRQTDVPLAFLAEADFNYTIRMYLTDSLGIKGGYEGVWTPDWSELRDAEQIKFHVFYTMDADEDKRLEFLMNITNASAEVPEPEIIR